ncbi:hypothetical protein EUBHAL_00861 [Anaerobutyricum hallii DSM 3353]|uniref:Uncharacterized protein n=1 Tax=Anaerobutyricum hallii DSM 3353 TaxID=411469 RepID=C0ETX8_9FIRM|nr:hypothetical protein EUBHAL_00861 [Anaerobutyricum hallii DSM 3353]
MEPTWSKADVVINSGKMMWHLTSLYPHTAKAQPLKRVWLLYLWPWSKVWMRALKASIQTAATKVTNIGVRFSLGASLCLRQIPI